jgi:predicted signal transduction protein with EAL and GGDEF domain
VTSTIRAAVRPADTVARLGGDEFVVVCEGLGDVAAAGSIAERILQAVRKPFQLAADTVTLTASIGVALSRPGSTPDQLLHDADQAMYGAKRAGKGRMRVGLANDPELLAQSARATKSLRVVAELEQALERNELVMFGQPVIDLRTGQTCAVETLIRWHHPERGLVGPAYFLDVAETSDLILPIGRRVLHESCRMAAEWTKLLGSTAPAVHVNVSGRQLEAGNLRSEVLEALDRYGVAPERLVLELTETHMPLLADSLRHDLENLRERGLAVAIDDLGTGYSSLSRITELPVDILKIDLSFVARMDVDPSCDAVVRGVLAIASAMDLTVIAEGVETVEQAHRLQSYGCDHVQGYLYSRPVPADALNAFLLQSNN